MDPSQPHDPSASGASQHAFAKPTPGGRGAVPRTSPPGQAGADANDVAPPDQGLNPLVAIANRLMMLAPALRATSAMPALAGLHDSLAEGVRDFEARATSQGIAPERVMAARYVLCAMIDEAAADTPWGGFGLWAPHSLLMLFHSEADGGERVFQLMARLAEKPDLNLDLLELIYGALTLGFQGRYRMLGDGSQLEAIRDRLSQIVQQQRGEHAHPLALHWHGRAISNRATRSLLPLAVSATLCALLLIGTFVWMSWSLNARVDAVYGAIQGLRLAPPRTTAAAPAAVPRLAPYLQADIAGGLASVREDIDRSVVTMRADTLFAPDGTAVLPEREATLSHLADALTHLSGNVIVTVHHDDQPLPPEAGQPTVWHLTAARARSVRDALLGHGIAADRVSVEGRGDTEPLVPNDTSGNRAINRRVEVQLSVAPAGATVNRVNGK